MNYSVCRLIAQIPTDVPQLSNLVEAPSHDLVTFDACFDSLSWSSSVTLRLFTWFTGSMKVDSTPMVALVNLLKSCRVDNQMSSVFDGFSFNRFESIQSLISFTHFSILDAAVITSE